MLATPPRTVADAILALFSEHRDLTAAELHKRVCARYFKCSLRAIYKELNQLLESGVILKVRGAYSLSLTWILNLIQFSERLYTVSVEQRSASLLPGDGEKFTWKFHDLQHLDRLWLQLMFVLFEQSPTRVMFAWVPHFWFDLVHYQKDLEAQEAMKIAGNKMYMILGGREYLDRLPTKYWSRQAYEWSYAISPFESQRSRYFDVIDDYILTVDLDQQTTKKIAAFFKRIRSASDLKLLGEFEAIKTGARVKMTLERNKKKASSLRRACCEYFGIKDRFK